MYLKNKLFSIISLMTILGLGFLLVSVSFAQTKQEVLTSYGNISNTESILFYGNTFNNKSISFGNNSLNDFIFTGRDNEQDDLIQNLIPWSYNLFALAPPSISSISPSTPSPSGSDQNVTVFGSNFVSGLTVTITFPSGGSGTLSGTQIQSVTSSSFVMRVTLATAGTWRIRVNNPNGEVSNTFFFNVQTAQSPSISSISPSNPTVSNSNQNVNVFGSNFQSGLTVTVFFPSGGSTTLSGSQIQSVSSSSFTMIITLNIVGTYGIRVNNPNGLQSGTFNFQTQAAAPVINSITPSGVCAQNGDRTFTVSGSNFQSGLTVTVFFPGGGSTTLSGSQIQFSSSTSFNIIVTLNIVGTYNFRVNNPNGTTSPNFSYATQNCSPAISSISPSSPTVNNSNQNVDVSGSNFQSGLTVTVFFPGGGSTTLSGSQIQSVTTNSFRMVITLNIVGQYGIRVNNPNGNQSNTFNFTTQAAPPTVSSISPSSPCVRNVDQSIAVNGSNFASGLTVSVTFPNGGTGTLSGSQIQNVTSSSFNMSITVADPGSYTIRVNNPGGAQSGPFQFSTQNCLSVSGTNPQTPTQSNVNQDVIVNGNGFAANLSVTITFPDSTTGTLSGSQILNVTSTSFTMRATLNAVGIWKIKVRNPNGDLSNIHSFNVQAPAQPTVTSINPSSPISSNVDQNITVNGSNFQAGLTVTVTFPNGGTGTLSGTQIQNVTATSFTMRVTLGNAGNWNLRVNNPNGGQSGVLPFTVQSGVQSPVIFSINPVTPVARGTDQDVVVSGSNFQQNLTVSITFPAGGGTTLSGTQIQNVTENSFIMRATLNAAGSWTIKVNNPDGGESPVFGFSVTGGGNNPVINSINPSTPMTNGADQNVIVNGSNFQDGLKVNVTFPNGGVATLQGTGQIQNVTANSFLMRITLNGVGAWNIRVINPDNSQSQQFAFNVQASGPPPTGLPTSVLSPVIGPLRVTSSPQGINDGKWEFDQHKSGNHTPNGGISLSNDTFAWDINLYTSTSGNADAGKAVFAVDNGEVISYVGTPPGGDSGAVLIAHPNATNPVWFSGYLHMTNIRVAPNQQVNATTVIGEIGRAGAENDHLHFVVYSGENTRGNLRSFNASITERLSNGTSPPTVSSINPPTVNQSGDLQLVTITGTNFQTNSIIEVQDPNGQYFTVTPETVSGLNDESKIESITSTSITARVTFAAGGNYEFSVINRPSNLNLNNSGDNSFTPSNSNIVYSAPSGRTPVILIPGIMGSRLGKRRANGGFQELWLAGLFNDDEHRELANEVEDPANYRPISARNVVATEVIRNINFGGAYTAADFYGNLITYLRNRQGYTLDNVENPAIGLGQCNSSRNNADLFVFPYDWRNSNFTSAQDLWYFIQCIKNIRGNPNQKVHIVAHSMGGLVARRYILANPGTHSVERMVTLGTPWLGATTSINIMQTGRYGNVNRILNPAVLKQIAPYMRGAHELIPSRIYDDNLQNLVLGENGWNDFDCLPQQTSLTNFNFNRLKATMNCRYSAPFVPGVTPYMPGTNTDTFHSQNGQDNWDQNNLYNVDYYNFVGWGKYTVGSLVAMRDTSGNPYLQDYPSIPAGDGTVPLSSALRYRPNRPDLPNYRGPIRFEKGFELDHTELASIASHDSRSTHPFVGCVVNYPNAQNCINAQTVALGIKEPEGFIDEPNYLLKVIGSESVIISDSFGNTNNPLSTSAYEGVRTVETNVTGNKYLSASFPLDQNYKAIIKIPSTPFSIILTKSDGQVITQAIRYVDISLSPNVLALLDITPQGISILKYDSDGNGTFDTPVNPTINVIGTQAQDITPPEIIVNETVQNGTSRIVLEATDEETGVQRIMYSTNGTTFQQYSTPLTLNPAQTPKIYAFADDNVANRSGLVEQNLTTSTAGYSVAGPSVANPGSQITANWTAPSGRPTDDWIGLFRVGTLNSAYISKQYTGGQTSGSLNFNLPNQQGIYEFRYLINDGFSSVVASNSINVTSNQRSAFDFDGDGKSDISVFRHDNGAWYLQQSTNGFTGLLFGLGTDLLAPADFDGDGKTDVAVFRDGFWYYLKSSNGAFVGLQFGQTGDLPRPADFDGDGKADINVFRPSNGAWYRLNSSNNSFFGVAFGQNGDKPLIADFDGDGKADVAVFRPSTGSFYSLDSSNGNFRGAAFGFGTDVPTMGDFDGDGKTDVAVFRPSNGAWYRLNSSTGAFFGVAFGQNGDIPVTADYDGDGKADVAVFRPSNGAWYYLNSSNGAFVGQVFGFGTDKPIPSAFQ